MTATERAATLIFSGIAGWPLRSLVAQWLIPIPAQTVISREQHLSLCGPTG